MAVQNPFFGKRDSESLAMRQALAAQGGSASLAGGPLARTAEAPAVPTAASSAAAVPAASGSQLTVGPNIKLKGVEITDCDTLVVEGTVEATMDSRVIRIAQQGAFRGAAEIDIAEIHGEFSGTLTARQKLVIHSTGRVQGTIRYGKLVVEEGGALSGEISADGAQARPAQARAAAAPLASESGLLRDGALAVR